MRALFAILFLVSIAAAQFKSTTQLVVVPTTITDSKGNYVDGLTPDDLILSDNNVPVRTQIDWAEYPISLVVAVQTSENAGAVIDKVGTSGILLSQLVSAARGETAMISFSDAVTLHQDFTDKPDLVTHAMRMLRKEGSQAGMLDALEQALQMLESRPPGRRRIIVMIAEKRDRSSQARLVDVLARVQRSNAVVYWLTWSPFLQPFTVKPKTAEDLKPEAERIKVSKCALCPGPDTTAVPADLGPGGYLYGLMELLRLGQPDVSALFTKATGGRTLNFLKKSALEDAIELVGREVHRQYILTFEPPAGEPGTYRRITVAVKNRPDLRITAREGYWVPK